MRAGIAQDSGMQAQLSTGLDQWLDKLPQTGTALGHLAPLCRARLAVSQSDE